MFVKMSLFFSKRLQKSSNNPQVRFFHKGLQSALRIPSEMLLLMLGSNLSEKGDTRLFRPGNDTADYLFDGGMKSSRIEVVFDGIISSTTKSSHGWVLVKAHFYKTGQSKSKPFMSFSWTCLPTGEISGPGISIQSTDPVVVTK